MHGQPGQTPVELNDRISPEYLALQLELHDRIKSYGTNSARGAAQIRQIKQEYKCETVLDYGCGKGALKRELGDCIVEYDPAIPGKDSDPDVCDMVVCTDVLEHIEPDKLMSVLEHIRQKCRKVAAFVIATRPAIKDLADGRNAHLIIEDEAWWKERLSVGFDIQTWVVDDKVRGVSCIAKPYLVIGQIEGVGVMSNDDRFDLVKENIAFTDKRLTIKKGLFYETRMPSEDEPLSKLSPLFAFPSGPTREPGHPLKFRWVIPKPHSRVAIIACYGPSLEDTWPDMLAEQAAIGKADIVSVSGAHDFVISKGIYPKYHVECDPRPHKGAMLNTPMRRIEYLMASCVHPDVLAKLKGYDVTLWHMNNGKGSERVLQELEPNAFLVPGGGSVGLRSFVLLYILGYRRFIVHGMDCSYKDGKSHAGDHTGKKIPPVDIVSNGTHFLTAPVLIAYMRYFEENIRRHIGDADTDPSKIEIILRGDGLLQHWLKAGGCARAGDMPTSEAA